MTTVPVKSQDYEVVRDDAKFVGGTNRAYQKLSDAHLLTRETQFGRLGHRVEPQFTTNPTQSLIAEIQSQQRKDWLSASTRTFSDTIFTARYTDPAVQTQRIGNPQRLYEKYVGPKA
jgi:hypothetical protein